MLDILIIISNTSKSTYLLFVILKEDIELIDTASLE